MSKTELVTFQFNYRVSRMDGDYNSLEGRLDKYQQKNPQHKIKQIEFLYGNEYGARVAVVFEFEED